MGKIIGELPPPLKNPIDKGYNCTLPSNLKHPPISRFPVPSLTYSVAISSRASAILNRHKRQDIEDDLKFIGRLKELWCVEADLERVGPRRFGGRFSWKPKELWLREGVLEPRWWYIVEPGCGIYIYTHLFACIIYIYRFV